MDTLVTAALSCAASAAAAVIAASTNRKISDSERKRDEAAARRDAEHDCIAAIARAQLVRDSERYQAQGWMPHEAKATYQGLYDSYKAMGEDGLITQTANAALSLPNVKKEDRP